MANQFSSIVSNTANNVLRVTCEATVGNGVVRIRGTVFGVETT